MLVAPRPACSATLPARIDGFTFSGADFSAGVVVNGYAKNLEISNNVVTNNRARPRPASASAHPAPVNDAEGEVVNAQNTDRTSITTVTQNGGTGRPGAGIGLYNGSDNYRVSNNYIVGNFAQGHGGGIAHFGRSPGGVIENNQILFNQSFDQTAGSRRHGRRHPGRGPTRPVAQRALSPGSGSVQIAANRIQGNIAGTGDGGGIALRTNGQDVLASIILPSWNRSTS